VGSARGKAYLYLLLVTIIWGLATPVIKYTLQGFEPGIFLVYRFFISTILALIILFPGRKTVLNSLRKHPTQIFLASFFGVTISLGALFLGLEKTTVLDSNIITSINPLIVVIAGAIFLNERVPSKEKFGAGLAFLGTIIAIVVPVVLGSENKIQLEGDVMIVLYMLADIVAVILIKKLLQKKVSSSLLSNISFIIGFITLTPIVLLSTPASEVINEIKSTPINYHLGVWYMAILSGTIAYYLRNKAQKTIEVGKVGLFAYLVPVVSVPVAVIWLQEKITLPFIVGAILIVIGVFIAEMNSSLRKKLL